MKLIATRQGRTDKLDQLRCVRRDGSQTGCPMPRQGILPHDLVHYVAESTLGWRHAFFGMVASGVDIGFAMEQAHDAARPVWSEQAGQAEAVVESLQAQLWGAGGDPNAFDDAMFLEGVRNACMAHGLGMPSLADGIGKAMFDAALALNARWQQVPWYGTLALEMADL